jgi:hypothetical protein
MSINRIFCFIDSDRREENRFRQALRWYEEANAVSEHLDSLTEGLMSFWVPSVSNLFEKADQFEVRVYFHAEEPLAFDDFERAPHLIAAELRRLSVEYIEAAERLEADGGVA